MAWWIWVLIGFLLLGVEFVSTTAHIGFFAAGAFLVAILVGAGWEGALWLQLVIFTVTSLVTLLIFRPMVVRSLGLGHPKPVDSMVGEQAIAMDDIAIQGVGKAEMRGTTWSAQNVGPVPLSKGQRCTVERIEGLMLHIRA